MQHNIINPRWGFFDLILVYLLTVVFTLLLAPLILGSTNDMRFFILGTVLQIFIMVLAIVLVVLWKSKARLSDLGLKPASSQDYLFYGVLGGFLLMVLMIVLGIPISRLQPDVQPQLFEEMLRSAGGMRNFAILLGLGAVLAPFSEELFYRGMVYPVFRRHLGPFWGAAAAGLIFGLAHWDLWRTVPLAIGGALLCGMYEKTGSIWVTTLAHGVWNGTMSVLVYFALSATI